MSSKRTPTKKRKAASSPVSSSSKQRKTCSQGFCKSTVLFETLFQLYVVSRFVQWRQREIWQRLEDFVSHDLWCMYDKAQKNAEGNEYLLSRNVCQYIMNWMDAQGRSYETNIGNPLTVFIYPPGSFPCNCHCGSIFLLACLECLGLFPGPYVYAALEKKHIYVGLENGDTNEVVETTSCNIFPISEHDSFDKIPNTLFTVVDVATDLLARADSYDPQLLHVAKKILERLWARYGLPRAFVYQNAMSYLNISKSIHDVIVDLQTVPEQYDYYSLFHGVYLWDWLAAQRSRMNDADLLLLISLIKPWRTYVFRNVRAAVNKHDDKSAQIRSKLQSMFERASAELQQTAEIPNVIKQLQAPFSSSIAYEHDWIQILQAYEGLSEHQQQQIQTLVPLWRRKLKRLPENARSIISHILLKLQTAS